MRMTKKAAAVALASMMALSLAGCSSNTEETTAAAETTAAETEAETTEQERRRTLCALHSHRSAWLGCCSPSEKPTGCLGTKRKPPFFLQVVLSNFFSH